jgi:hypothetical protein
MKLLVALFLTLLTLPVFAQDAPTPTPLSDDPDTQAAIERLLATPILYNLDTDVVREIYEHGQTLGNRADMFTKVGDSNSTSGDFLQPMGDSRRYCRLGDYDALQTTIDYFSASYDGGDSNSFTWNSLAAHNGLSSDAALDPMWAGEGCQGSENPVQCEYRRARPSIAIIMLGLMDVRYQTDPDTFKQNMATIIEYSIQQGVIPVLTNLVVLPDQEALSFDLSIQLDAAMLDLADEYQIPLINLWAAVQELPGYGIGPDRTHLKHEVGAYCDFTGKEQEIGGTLRNLLTLQALDGIRQAVGDGN